MRKIKKATSKVFSVIMVGGKGKRLRPLSTDFKPKAFLSVTSDGKSMFHNTISRVAKIIPRRNIIVVANRIHSGLVKKDFPDIQKKNLILETVSKNTAPAITLVTRALEQRKEDAILVVLPTDHYILDEDKQLACLKKGIDFVKKNADAMVTLGLSPTFPSTEFGYIRINGSPTEEAEDIYKVKKFVEKPNLGTAEKYVESGKYLWNTGVFIFRSNTMLKAIKKYAPRIFYGLKYPSRIFESYEKMPDISIDYAVIEKADNIYCVKGSYRWNDMGSFGALKRVLKRESRDYIEEDGKIIKIL